MRNLLTGVMVVGTLLVSLGCGHREPTPVPVRGTVTLDGEPLSEGQISFITAGQVPETLEVKNGAFSGQVKWGTRRVEIGAYRPLKIPPEVPVSMHPLMKDSKENYLPEKYNVQSELTADVKAKGSNEFHFQLFSK